VTTLSTTEPATTRAAYAELPRRAGAWFLPVAFGARLPFSMVTIGALLLVTATSGSVAQGGLASAAVALGTAVGGPMQGVLTDRTGQRPVLLVATLLETAALLALVHLATSGAPAPAVLAAAALVGLAAPQVGPLVRVRWLALTAGDPRTLRAAMSYESTADEVSFVLGPALVGILATAGSPATTLLVAAGCCLVLGTAVALHPTAALRAAVDHRDHAPLAALARSVALPAAGMLAMGLLFGGTQAAITGFMGDAGHEGSAGLVYAVMGVGSAITALSVAALPAGWALRGRWITFAAGLVAGTALLLGAASTASVPPLVGAVALTGLFVGPVMVTVFTVGGERAPGSRASAAMTMLASANVLGIALGASAAGRLAESTGTASAFAVPVVAAVLLLAAGVALRERARTSAGQADPVSTSAAAR
jgi:MFS family permease